MAAIKTLNIISPSLNSFYRFEECESTDAIGNCENCNSFQPSCKNSSDCEPNSACCREYCYPSNCYSCKRK